MAEILNIRNLDRNPKGVRNAVADSGQGFWNHRAAPGPKSREQAEISSLQILHCGEFESSCRQQFPSAPMFTIHALAILNPCEAGNCSPCGLPARALDSRELGQLKRSFQAFIGRRQSFQSLKNALANNLRGWNIENLSGLVETTFKVLASSNIQGHCFLSH
jgi:hypothetical protein